MASEENQQASRGIKRAIQGKVTSSKMDKTVVVTVVRRLRDKQFHKFVTRKLKYRAHDEGNVCNEGDVVEITEARPYSKTKRWRVSKTITKAREALSLIHI